MALRGLTIGIGQLTQVSQTKYYATCSLPTCQLLELVTSSLRYKHSKPNGYSKYVSGVVIYGHCKVCVKRPWLAIE